MTTGATAYQSSWSPDGVGTLTGSQSSFRQKRAFSEPEPDEHDRQDIYSDLENKMAARILKDDLAGKVMAPIGKASALFELTIFPRLDVFGDVAGQSSP